MNEQQLNTVAQLRAFLNGTQEVQFEHSGEDTKRNAFISSVVKRLRYRRLARADKGGCCAILDTPSATHDNT